MLGGLGLDYPSSDDSGSDDGSDGQSNPSKRLSLASPKSTTVTAAPTSAPPPRPRPRKMPSLPPTFDSASAAHNNPSAHQGRRRSRPFVDGDYYAHVYLELDVSLSLRRAIDAALAEAGSISPQEVHALLPANGKLHVSVSHPLPLRRDAVETFPHTLAAALRSTGRFALSLAGAPVVYFNTLGGPSRAAGRGTPTPGARAFLGLRVGAGAKELVGLLGRVESVLKKMHLPLYHAQPEFHASFGWALCPDASTQEGEGDERAVTPFPDDLVARLAGHTDAALAAHPGWHVSTLNIKVAKEVTTVQL